MTDDKIYRFTWNNKPRSGDRLTVSAHRADGTFEVDCGYGCEATIPHEVAVALRDWLTANL